MQSAEEELRINKKRSKKAQRKYEACKKTSKVEPALEEQFTSGRLLASYLRVSGSAVAATVTLLKAGNVSSTSGRLGRTGQIDACRPSFVTILE